MHLKLIRFLLKLKAKRIIYVSCNPATCARDLDYLCHGIVSIIADLVSFVKKKFSCFNTSISPVQVEKNIEGCYKLCSLQPVDMFPHTPHIECVCLLELA